MCIRSAYAVLTPMELSSLGRFLFGAAMASFGVQQFMYAIFGYGLGPPWTPENQVWAYVTGVVLIATTVSIAVHRKGLLGIVLGTLLFLRLLFLQAPALATTPHDPNLWTSAAEMLAMAGAAWVLADPLPASESWGGPDITTIIGRILFAVPLLIFGVQHFLYSSFIATLVPSWLFGRVFWANFVGVAFLAAGLSILTGVWATLGASWLGAMFLLWVVMLHAPRVATAPHDSNEWTSAIVALAMAGGAFLVAASFDRGRAESARPKRIVSLSQ